MCKTMTEKGIMSNETKGVHNTTKKESRSSLARFFVEFGEVQSDAQIFTVEIRVCRQVHYE